MNYNELKKFVENVKYHKYWTGGGKGLNEHKDLSMDEDFDLIKSMNLEKEFVVKDSSVEFLCNMIPERFIKNEQIVFHYKGNFWALSLKDHICKPHSAQPDDTPIYDLQRGGLGDLAAKAGMAIQLLEQAINAYESRCDYYPWNYAVIEKVECSDKYDSSYSLTNEDVKKMQKWEGAHMKKHHKDWYEQYHGASPVWPFELKWGSCSLGTYADTECTICRKKYEEALKENKDPKEIENIKKDMSFEVRGIE